MIYIKIILYLVRRRSCGGILGKSGHIRGAKQDSLNEYPYRQAFEKMNDAVHIN